MIKMLIKMNNDKVMNENKYDLNAMYHSIDSLFAKMGCEKQTSEADDLLYLGNNSPNDFSHFAIIVNTLKRKDWFLDNAEKWVLYDNESDDDSPDFSEEDLLLHYRKKYSLRV